MSNCGKSLKRCLRTTRIHAVRRKTLYERNDNCRVLRVQRVNDHLTPEGPEVDSQSAPPPSPRASSKHRHLSGDLLLLLQHFRLENAAAVQSLESGAIFSSTVNRELHHNSCAPGFSAGRYGLNIMMMCDTCGLHHDTRYVRDARCGFLQLIPII